MNVSPVIVWHEFGHIFGYELVSAIYFDYRIISEISLNEKPYRVCPKKNINKNNDNSKIEIEKNILIFIMGSVFHVTKHKNNKNISFSDFSKISTNLNRELNYDDLYGHAGKDFLLLEKYLIQENTIIENIELINFSLNVQKELNKFDIFKKIDGIINSFEKKYNGKTTIGDNLVKEERRELNKIISEKLINRIKQMFVVLFKNKY